MSPKSASRSWLPIGPGTLTRPACALPDGYRDRAHEIGKLRVVQGGWRVAEFFEGILDLKQAAFSARTKGAGVLTPLASAPQFGDVRVPPPWNSQWRG